MLLGLLLIILALYGLLLFWALNERLKSNYQVIKKVKDQLKEIDEKLTLVITLWGENSQERGQESSENFSERFSFEAFKENKG
ncbi:MAG: hypothetical protein PWP04_80 [Candidatus Atribacteria bacterium]|nr:hypothetical protein [Candidatus Atribacteria bacterium]